MSDGPDIVIIGSGIGGATLAAALAPTGRRIVILERGERLADCAEARDDRAIFARGHFRPQRDLVHARRRGLQSGQLLLRRRQLEILRRGADPLSRRGFPPAPAPRRHHARLADHLRRARAMVSGRGGALRGSGATPRRTRPSPRIPAPTPFRRSRTSRRSPTCGRDCVAPGSRPHRCRSGSTPTAGLPGPRRPGTPFPTPPARRWTRRMSVSPRHCASERDAGDRSDRDPSGRWSRRPLTGVEYEQRRGTQAAQRGPGGACRRGRQLSCPAAAICERRTHAAWRTGPTRSGATS